MRRRNINGPEIVREHRVEPTSTKGQRHEQPVKKVERVIFAVLVALDNEPAVLHEGGGEFHAEAAEEEEVAGRVAEANRPGEEGEAVVEEDGDVLLF